MYMCMYRSRVYSVCVHINGAYTIWLLISTFLNVPLRLLAHILVKHKQEDVLTVIDMVFLVY